MWGFVVGLVLYAVAFFGLGGVVIGEGLNAGVTNSYHNCGFAIMCSMVVIHHAQMVVETRNFTWLLAVIYVVNFVFYPLMIQANDAGTVEPSQVDGYQHNQFAIALKSPLIYLATILSAFIAVAPRHAWLCLEHAVWRPEFAKVNGS